ncbi:hypothetical protein APHAL10511_001293 [Amanita phalloides]|nr:hypothetical protein APHAL10511_001293 [Amanita phalloides]
MSCTQLKAVIFDIGGVVLKSPFIAIAAYEKELGLPPNYLNCLIVGRGSQGAWQKFERGETNLLKFYEAFGRDLSDARLGNELYARYCERKGVACPLMPTSLVVNGRELFVRMMRESQQYDPYVREAIVSIREAGEHKLIALTNNFSSIEGPQSEFAFLGWDANGPVPQQLKELFDDFCDSSTFGMRKPEPEFYLLACSRNGFKPEEAVFLDDIGINIKAAQKLGMKTIRVSIGETIKAVRELESLLGLKLIDTSYSAKL